MHFSYSQHGNGSKATKFMLIAGLHVALGILFVHGLNTRKIPLGLPEQVLVMIEPERPAPPVPPEAPKPAQQLAPPDIVVPKVEVAVAPPPEPAPVRSTTEPAPSPNPFTPAQATPEAPPAANTSANTSRMHSALFADANSCALPDYPASAARNGDTGITTLALLVGTDGRVSSARIEQSSGSRVLDRAALNALSLCKFKPAMNNGVPAAGWAQLAYVWKLD
ncbi:energy transducer TonB [Massilia sp. LXY-6]|uniref:energy transducer TonB n=1 Tax=Massilia sp. LXY-6 TaxID=3379823 RepID=UPI003EDE9A76